MADCWVVSFVGTLEKSKETCRRQVSEVVRCLGYSDAEAALFISRLNQPP
jgi:hypothetical protein